MNNGERGVRALDGPWGLLPDPMDRAGRQRWWQSQRREGEFFPSYDDDAFWPTRVPGAFNRIHEKLTYYEGKVVYLHHFQSTPAAGGECCFLHFEGVADRCRVFLNGRWVGEHDGGFVPFSLDVTNVLAEQNRLLIYVDNTRRADGVPALIHDWWHDGGIHRPVSICRVPACHVREASIRTALHGDQVELEFAVLLRAAHRDRPHTVRCRVTSCAGETVATCSLDAFAGVWGRTRVSVPRERVPLWQPGTPALCRLEVTVGDDCWCDTVGLREIRTEGNAIVLNGEPVVLRGICTWMEDPERGIFSMSAATAAKTVDLLQALNCNFARAGHCPPSREFIRACDRAGILVWAEIPAYWIPTMHESTQSGRALHLLESMVRAYRNNPSVVIWCIGNECLYNEINLGQSNLNYFLEATDLLHEQDPSRLVTYTGGLEGPGHPRLDTICPQAIVAKLDVVSFNSYSGINDGANPEKPEEFGMHLEKIKTANQVGKPVILAEIGIDAVKGERGFDYGEQRQADYHQKVQELFAECVTDGLLQGMTPFVLNDFATPIKLGRHQRGYNRKGLVTETLERKASFDVVSEGYHQIMVRDRSS